MMRIESMSVRLGMARAVLFDAFGFGYRALTPLPAGDLRPVEHCPVPLRPQQTRAPKGRPRGSVRAGWAQLFDDILRRLDLDLFGVGVDFLENRRVKMPFARQERAHGQPGLDVQIDQANGLVFIGG